MNEASSFTARVIHHLSGLKITKNVQFIVMGLALCSCVATLIVMHFGSGVLRATAILPYLYLNLALLILIAIFIVKRVVVLWLDRKRGIRGTKLHFHLIMVLAITCLLPAVGISIFSTFFFNSSIKSLFTEPFKTTINAATEIAENYIKENQKTIRIDGMSMVMQLRPVATALIHDADEFNHALTQLSEQRGLNEVLVLDGHLNIIAKSYFTFALAFENISLQDLAKAKEGEIVLFTQKDKVRALLQLDPVSDTYLFIGKMVSEEVTKALDKAKGAVTTYSMLEIQQGDIQLTFLAFFAILVLVLILASAWLGLSLANTLFSPISKLIEAADRVSHGDLTVRIENKPLNNEIDNLISAFNHMTHRLKKQNEELAFNQRKAAWADVARKIAHEIKNPLTPIQLSAERLKRKYLNQIETDQDTFQNCIDTIVRQVNHIGNLVNEFSSFARMPDPKTQEEDLVDLCKQALDLQIQAYPHIAFNFSGPKNFLWDCDSQQINQLLTNLLQNAINAVEENKISKPSILLQLLLSDKHFYMIIEDNGPGFEKENRDRLIEPYYTTREKGTGLGLAIVSKIAMDHNGTIEFKDREHHTGAKVVLEFSYSKKE
ncbi:MAG: ATP-binding protein [Pseudomonadota bacterium]|jgi:two-component system nitrogen regulation sensor histidine kinase NtrY|nr:ATP-binding protein [Alphaproteobacteria bacterium]